MRKRKKHINLIGCLFLMGLLGLCGCGSPSSESEMNMEQQGSAASGENAGADEMAEKDEQGAQADPSETELIYENSMELKYAKNFSIIRAVIRC